MAEKWITSGEAATLLKAPPRTVRSWGERGILDTVRSLGGQRLYRETQIRDILAKRDPPPKE